MAYGPAMAAAVPDHARFAVRTRRRGGRDGRPPVSHPTAAVRESGHLHGGVRSGVHSRRAGRRAAYGTGAVRIAIFDLVRLVAPVGRHRCRRHRGMLAAVSDGPVSGRLLVGHLTAAGHVLRRRAGYGPAPVLYHLPVRAGSRTLDNCCSPTGSPDCMF